MYHGCYGKADIPTGSTMAPTSSPKERAPGASHRVSSSGDLEVGTYLEIAREREGERPGR